MDYRQAKRTISSWVFWGVGVGGGGNYVPANVSPCSKCGFRTLAFGLKALQLKFSALDFGLML